MDMSPGVWVKFVDSLPAELQNCRTVPVEFIKLIHAEDLLLLCDRKTSKKKLVNVKKLASLQQSINDITLTKPKKLRN